MKKIIITITSLFSIPLFSQTIDIAEFAVGFTQPVEIVNAGDQRLFVVEQGGAVKIVNPDGSVNGQNFLTVPAETMTIGGERGLLGLAFHPMYASNGYFYISYTSADNVQVIARYSVDPSNPNLALANSGTTILTVPHSDIYHYGGTLRFGPDGYLYIASGDGETPLGNAQDISNNLGKILRIDVNHPTAYSIPVGNMYAGTDGSDEIWAMGLRNPWKYSFDRASGDLWIADVGQANYEEINHVPSTSTNLNFGWPCYEANTEYAVCGPALGTYTFPVGVYTHSESACSITGGYVYRGTQYPNMQGKYFFSDFCSNQIWMLNPEGNSITHSAILPGEAFFFSAFGEDSAGELYVASWYYGKIYKIFDTMLARKEFPANGFALSPNPANSEFTVKLDPSSYPARLSIIDLSGKILLEEVIGSEDHAVAAAKLHPGIYVATLTDKNGAVSSSKLAITR